MLANINVHLRWDMNLYLHYGVDHKQSVLKSNDKAKSNLEQNVKYNLSNTRKTPKTKATGRRKHHRRRRVCHRTIPCSSLTQEIPKHHQDTAKDAECGHHAWPKVCRTPWHVMTTRRSPMSFPAVAGSSWARGWLRARLGGACRLEGCRTSQI
jgi:hypothetical protein